MRKLLLLSLSLAGCAEEAAPDPAELELLPTGEAPPPVINACGDATVYVRAANDTAAIVLDIPGIVAAANQAAGPISQRIQLPDRRVTGEQWRGTNVTAATCTGVIMPPGPQIRTRKELVGGMVAITASAFIGFPGMPPAADLDITLTDPEFLNPNGSVTVIRGTFVWPQVMAGGFYP